jgi:hypothetical protein
MDESGVTPTSEYEQARTAVSVACLRWLRSEVEAVQPPPRIEAVARDTSFRQIEPPDGPIRRERDHPLWDVWLDG